MSSSSASPRATSCGTGSCRASAITSRLQDDGHLRAERRRRQRRARDGLPQFDEAHAFRRHHRNHRHAELFAQRHEVDDHAVLLGDIDHVQRDDDGMFSSSICATRYRLRSRLLASTTQMITSGRGVSRLPAEQHIAGHGFIGRTHLQAVAAGQIEQFHRLAVAAEKAARLFLDGHAGIIADLLPQAGQRIEDRALAAVRIARDGHVAGDITRRAAGAWQLGADCVMA